MKDFWIDDKVEEFEQFLFKEKKKQYPKSTVILRVKTLVKISEYILHEHHQNIHRICVDRGC